MEEKLNQQNESELRRLFEAYLTGELAAENREALAKGLESVEGEDLIKSVMLRKVEELPSVESLKIKDKMDQWLSERLNEKAKVRRLKMVRYAVAAAILVCLAGASFFVFYNRHKDANSIAVRYKNDIQPGSNKAMLKLSDGRMIELSDANMGHILDQNDAEIDRGKGGISYKATGKDVHYNDLYTPSAGQMQLVLADGTKVWLDASSSIHFPTAFPSGNREVFVTGQAYFEVAKNPKQPFVVHVKDQTVQVLGTHFNVNAYGSSAVKTTLAEGSVRVQSGSQILLLKPGEQSDGMRLKKDADLEEVLAWKNGMFSFNGASVEAIMDQVARWYGAEIVYKDKISEEFVAKVPRTVPVSRLLKYLEQTGQVHFLIEGNKITVMR